MRGQNFDGSKADGVVHVSRALSYAAYDELPAWAREFIGTMPFPVHTRGLLQHYQNYGEDALRVTLLHWLDVQRWQWERDNCAALGLPFTDPKPQPTTG